MSEALRLEALADDPTFGLGDGVRTLSVDQLRNLRQTRHEYTRWWATVFRLKADLLASETASVAVELQPLIADELQRFFAPREMSPNDLEDSERRLIAAAELAGAAFDIGMTPLDVTTSRRLLEAADSAGASMDVRVNLAVGARDTVLLDEVESVDHGYEAAQARLAVGRLTGDAEALGAARMLFARLKESSEQPWVRAYAELKLSEIALRVGEDALPRLRAQDSLDADLALVALDSPLLRGLRCSLRAEAARESLIRIAPERSFERLPLEAELILAERCAVYGVSL